MLPEIGQAWKDSFWYHLTPAKTDFLRLKVGPLLRYVPGVDVEATTFTSKVERLKLQLLTGKDASAAAQSIAEDVSRLPQFVYDNPQLAPLAWLCLYPPLQCRPDSLLASGTERLSSKTPPEADRPVRVTFHQLRAERCRPLVYPRPDS